VFHGEVSAASFITGAELSNQLGFSAGVLATGEISWLHFTLDGLKLYVPKRSLRYGLTKTAINSAQLTHGVRTVTIGGRTYKVRLLKGLGEGVTSISDLTSDSPVSWGSEWNRLFYPIVAYPTGISREGIAYGRTAKYSIEELNFVDNTNGSLVWCAEEPSSGSSICRGGVSNPAAVNQSLVVWTENFRGWRPVLELVK